MELSLLLIQEICQLFIILLLGFILVKTKILTSEDSKVLSKLTLYVVSPCAILTSFLIAFTQDKLIGLLFAFIGALIVHIVYIPLTNILARIFKFNPIEKASVIYSNSANLIIPLVGAILGQEWVIYTSGYMVVQTILLWTHAQNLVSGQKDFNFKRIILNINVIAIMIGIVLFISQIQLPTLVVSTFSKVGTMIGPLAMLVIGMLIGHVRFEEVFSQKKAYFVCFLRLLVFPLIMILFFKLSGFTTIIENGTQILLITILASCAPVAATVTQFAQIHNKDASYASVLNVMSVVFSVITMPLIIMIYQLY